MEISINIISTLLFITLFVFPILVLFILNRKEVKHKFLVYLSLSLFVTAIIFLLFAWWTDYSNELLLAEYGYDFGAINNVDKFIHVASEKMDKVKNLETSIMGVGWPLKAIITYPFYSLYLLLVYQIVYGFNKYKTFKSDNS